MFILTKPSREWPLAKNKDDHIDNLKKEIARKDKIIAALMGRVEQSMKSSGGAFSLFESNSLLTQQVEKRTQDLKKERALLNEANEFNKSIIQSLFDALLVIDDKGVIKHINGQALALSGYKTIESLISLNFKDDLLDEASRDAFNIILKRLGSNHSVRDVEVYILLESGEKKCCQLSMKRLGTKSESREQFICILKDLTEMKKMEETVNQERLKAMNSAKLASLGEMAGGIAHEINNPLTIISGRSAFIRKMHENGIFKEESLVSSLDAIDSTLIRISKIIHGLKTVSRSGQQFEKEEIAVVDFFDTVLSLCSEKFKSIGIAMKIDTQHPLYSRHLMIDQVQLSQVMINLLGNAADAIEEQDEKWIKIEFADNDQFNMIRILDSGPGVPEELQYKIFNPFYTSKVIGKGTGLGLSISKSIMEKHGGDLELDQESKNTCFVLKLPK